MPDIFTEDHLHAAAKAAVRKELTVLNPVHIFTTFMKNPKGISFAEQENDESIVLFLRRDFITNVPWIVAALGLLFIPFLIKFLLFSSDL